MTYLRKSLSLLVSLLGVLGLVACDDYGFETFDYVDKTTVSLESSALHSLTIKWTEVDDVSNYKYVFVEGGCGDSKDNPLAEGSTSGNSLVFENLTPGTTYTLWITPVSDSGKVSRSFYGSYSTIAITPLDTPVVTCTLDTITYDVSVEWNAVENAVDYTWYYVENNDTITDTTTDRSFSFNAKHFGEGTHFVYVIANYYEEAHTNSNRGTGTYTLGVVTESIAELLEGTYTVYNEGYTCYNLSSWKAFSEEHTTTVTMVDETTIKIKNLYKSIGLEGYIDQANMTITFAPNKSSSGYWCIYGFDGNYTYQTTTPQMTGYYEEDPDYGYVIYLYSDNVDYIWSYGYDYSSYGSDYGWYPYWIGNSSLYKESE
jgi:hypothetical protein